MNARPGKAACALTVRCAARVSVVVALIVTSAGCRAHAVVEAPPPATAPLIERATAYEALKPKALVLRDYRWLRGQRVGMQLSDGTVVEDPLDLAPALAPGARTLVHAEKARELDETSDLLRYAGLVVASAMLGSMIYGFTLLADDNTDDAPVNTGPPNNPPPPSVEPDADAWLMGTTLIGSVASLALIVPAWALTLDAERERVAAFYAYPQDLRDRLALVKNQRALVARWQQPVGTASTATRRE